MFSNPPPSPAAPAPAPGPASLDSSPADDPPGRGGPPAPNIEPIRFDILVWKKSKNKSSSS